MDDQKNRLTETTLLSTQTYNVGTQKTCLIETAQLSTQKMHMNEIHNAVADLAKENRSWAFKSG